MPHAACPFSWAHKFSPTEYNGLQRIPSQGGIELSCNKPENAYRYGTLPGALAPLAMSYVPMQASAAPNYEASEALARGTLFPGLDLPFLNIVNEKAPDTPLGELMEIDFVVDELELYFDTHAEDAEAFALYQNFLALKKEAHERYAARFGPICQSDQLGQESYSWLSDPWPWDYTNRRER